MVHEIANFTGETLEIRKIINQKQVYAQVFNNQDECITFFLKYINFFDNAKIFNLAVAKIPTFIIKNTSLM